MSLSPPPSREKLPVTTDKGGRQSAEMPFAWLKWFSDIKELLAPVASGGLLLWSYVSKTGSNITDIETRNHADLQNINTATYTHLSATNATDLTDGGNTVLHQHTRYMDVATYDTDADGIVDSAENIVIHVRNSTGSTMPKGSAVYISGATGQMPTVTLARADAEGTSSKTLGLLNAALLNNANGYAIVTGRLAQVDTSAFNDGDTLWLSAAVSGGLTNVPPSDPNHTVFIGYCAYSQNNNGIIVINIQNGYELNELHNVVAASPADKNGLLFNSGTSLWEARAIAGDDVFLPANTGTTHTLTDLNNYGHSAGILFTADFDSLVVASGIAGSVDVAAFTCYFRTSASPTAELKYYSIASATVSIPTNTTRYIIASYNAGTPTITASAVDSTDGYVTFTLAFVENIGGVVHMIVPIQDRFNDHSHTVIHRMWESMGVERVSGAVLGQPANLQVSVTAGAFWAKASRFTSLAFDSSTATGANSGTFFTYYYTGAAWVETASLTALPVTQYNDITSGLVTMVANRWAYYDVYLGVNDGDVRILYGQAQYLTQADASIAALSSILPTQIGDITYQFIGRLIFQKSAASFALVLSAFATELAAAGITDHNALANLQGGAANDYSHITAAQYTDLTDGGDSTLHYHASDRSLANITGLGTGVGTALAVNVGSTGSVVVNGDTNTVGIGSAPITNQALRVNPSLSGAVVQQGLFCSPTFDSTATTAYSLNFGGSVDGAIITNYFSCVANNPTLLNSATITNCYGFYVTDITRGGTLNAGVRTGVTSGAGKWNIYALGSASNAFNGSVRIGSVVAPTVALDVTGAILATTTILSSGATSGIGYTTGAGGTVTQATSRTTGVTLNKVSGAITLVSAAGSATPSSFTVTNSAVAATDTVIVNQKSGTDLYEINVTSVAAGSFQITSKTTGGTTTEQPVFNFNIIKGVAA